MLAFDMMCLLISFVCLILIHLYSLPALLAPKSIWKKKTRLFSQMSREDSVMEQAMVVTFPQDDPKVCHVSFRVGVPLLMIQVASVDAGRMKFGDRHSLDLRKAGSVVADEEKVSILSRAPNGQHPHLILELHMDKDEEIQAWTRALRNVLPKATKAPTSPPSKDEQEESRIIFSIIFLCIRHVTCSFSTGVFDCFCCF